MCQIKNVFTNRVSASNKSLIKVSAHKKGTDDAGNLGLLRCQSVFIEVFSVRSVYDMCCKYLLTQVCHHSTSSQNRTAPVPLSSVTFQQASSTGADQTALDAVRKTRSQSE